MITTEEAEKFFEDNKIEKPNLGKLIEFDENLRTFGKIITQTTKEHKENKKKKYYEQKNARDIALTIFKETFKEKDYLFNPFDSKEGEALAIFLFGEVVGKTIAKIWDKINTEPYQDGYSRRSFRTKEPIEKHLKKKIDWLFGLYDKRLDKSALFDLEIGQLIQYMGYKGYYTDYYSWIIAVYLEEDKDGSLKELIMDIFSAEDEIGVVTQGLIKGVLLCDEPQAWEMVGKLLLASQRQEGLRQTILESLDETSIGALKYIVNLMLEHELYRFSSVVRAVDVWFGFGWEAPKKATIKRILELSASYLNEPQQIEKVLKKSRDNLELYVALWTKAVVEDVDEANLLAIDIVKNDKTREKKLLAFMFMRETNRTHASLLEWTYENFAVDDAILDYYMLELLPINQAKEATQKLFEKILFRIESLSKEGLLSKGKVFEWKELKVTKDYFYSKILEEATEEILQNLGENIILIPSDVREHYIGKVFPKHKILGWYISSINSQKLISLELEEDSWKREILYQALVDKNSTVQATALNVLRSVVLYGKDYQVIETLFKRKNKDVRKFLIEFVLKQKEDFIEQNIETLLGSKDISQRLGGLEMLTLLHDKNRLSSFVSLQVKSYEKRVKFSKNEEMFLGKFTDKKDEVSFTHINGYAVVDYDQLQEIYQVEDKFLDVPKDKNIFDAFIDKSKVVKAINDLVSLFKANEGYEYSYEGWNGELCSTLLVDRIEHKKSDTSTLSKEEKFKELPLAEIWEKWYRDSELTDLEMMVAYGATTDPSYKYVKKSSKGMISRYCPTLQGINLKIEERWDSFDKKIHKLIKELTKSYCDRANIVSFQLDILETMMSNSPTQVANFYTYLVAHNLENYWDLGSRELELIERKWKLAMALFYRSLDKTNSKLPSELVLKIKKVKADFLPHQSFTMRLYREGILNHHDLFSHVLLAERNFISLFENMKGSEKDSFSKFSKESSLTVEINYAELKKNFLEVELLRGDLETEVSRYISSFETIDGIAYFRRILTLIGKAKLNTHIFSSMLRKTKAKKEESFEAFQESVESLGFNEQRWLEIAMYLPQWSEWIGKIIKLEALKDAVWWFKAHASETYYLSNEEKTLIGRYSSISSADFERGALDIEWFNEVYPKIKKANWTVLTEFAKYSCHGNGHRLVKLYSSIILGQVKIREINKKVKEKRDKDYVRGLGLVPLSKKTPQKDLLTRYNLLQSFLKESKQFGSQRQESEKSAVEIAMDNLSRTAGYSDSIRLSLAMEAKATQEIMQNSVLTFDEVVLSLKIDDFGKADIFIEKAGKTQKSIPAKYKKEKFVKALVANKNYLKKQYSRIVKFLEESMVTQEPFTIEEIEHLMEHPVVKALLSKVFFFVNEKELATIGSDGFSLALFGAEASDSEQFDANDTCVIAHPVHLYKSKKWSEVQKFAFDTQLVQPFKQIFRELYLMTDDEKEKAVNSKRYEGHQIQPQKTVALLKTRGWRVDSYDGLQKIFHKDGYTVTLYAMADWFSPSDVESPTIEHISFYSLKEQKALKLVDVDEVVFSEVMRDIDLVVSVAHVGGVDPEASHSTLEMRAVLAKESARLFKLENVEVKERHILIDGKLGNYSIHLGSGMVAKAGLHLSIIPVHSQHRGRVFLPFIDDDPKSAEIISKMKMLSEDDKILDPTVLSQINR